VFQECALPWWKSQSSIQVRPDIGFFSLTAEADVVHPEFSGQDVHDFQIIAQALVRLKFRGKALHVCSALVRPREKGAVSSTKPGPRAKTATAPSLSVLTKLGSWTARDPGQRPGAGRGAFVIRDAFLNSEASIGAVLPVTSADKAQGSLQCLSGGGFGSNWWDGSCRALSHHCGGCERSGGDALLLRRLFRKVSLDGGAAE
jgi:hypothetical protein